MTKAQPPNPSPAEAMRASKKAFILMPFCAPYNSYYNGIFKPALEDAGYQVTRADDLFEARPIILSIQTSILDADLILCEMSGKNPNVFYELGLAHAIGRPVILVSHDEEDIPFDLRHIRVIMYNYTLAGWEAKLRGDIRQAVQETEQRETIWPPPLFRGLESSSALLTSRELKLKSLTKRRELVIEANLAIIETLYKKKIRLLQAGVDIDDPELLSIPGVIAEAEEILANIERELASKDGGGA